MLSRLKLFIPLIIFLLLALAFFQLESRMVTGDYDPSNIPSALIGKPVPAFNLSRLDNAECNLSTVDIKGPALINVWATWCISCRVEHAYLNELAKRGVTIYGLNYKDDREEANLWLSRLGNPYQFNIFDSEGKLGLNMGVYGAPETYIIDAEGVIRYRHVGVLDEKVWQTKIVALEINFNE